MKKHSSTETIDALQIIEQTGDPVDGRRRFRRGFQASLSRGSLLLVEGATVGLTAGNHEIFAAPAIGALGAVGVGMVYGAGRLVERQRVKRADALQDMVRSALGEPIDIVRSGSKKDASLTLRWYGAEEADAGRDTVRRLAQLNAAAREYAITRLAIGADWIDETLLSQAEPETYGTITSGVTWMAEHKNTRLSVNDLKTDDAVLLATPDQIDALLETLRSTGDTRLLGELIDASDDQQLRAAYDSYLAHPQGGMTELVRQAHLSLSRSLDEHIGDETHIARDMYGNPNRQRVYRTVHIERGRLNILGQSLDTQTGVMNQDHEAADLLRLCGVETLDELIEQCDTDDEHMAARRQRLTTAIYLLAHQEDERRSAHGGLHQVDLDMRSSEETFFQRMTSEQVYRLRLRTKLSRTIEYGVRSRVKATLGAAGLYLGAMALGGGVAVGADALETMLYHQQIELCKESVPSYGAMMKAEPMTATHDTYQTADHECDAWYAHAHPVEAMFSQSVNELDDIEFELSTQALDWLYDVVGSDTLHAVIGSTADWPKTEWLANSLQTPPPSYYRDNFDQSFMGDVDLKANQTIYTVTSPKGRTSEGYWYGEVFDKASVLGNDFHFERTEPPLNDATKDGEGYAFITAPSDELIKQLDMSAEFIVTSPYVKSGMTDLPVHEGTGVAGAVIVDANDPSRMLKPREVAKSTVTGLYTISLSEADIDAMWNTGIKTPQLKYWLTPETPARSHFAGPLQYPSIYAPIKPGELVHSDDMAAMAAARKRLAQDAKAALGLSPGASDSEVLAAIRDGKTYSFTPLADSGTKLNLPATDDAYGQMDQLAQEIERLHSLNCNLASAAYLFATADGPGLVNQAQGFHDNGDGQLTQRESHAWLVDVNGKKIDPTPTSGNVSEDALKPASKAQEAPSAPSGTGEVALTGMAVLGALMLGIRRRRDLLQRALELRLQVAIRGKHAPRAMDVMESSLYGAPVLRADRDWATTLPFDTHGAVAERLSRLVPVGGLSTESHEAIHESLANPTLRPAERRATKRLLRASKLVDKTRQ